MIHGIETRGIASLPLTINDFQLTITP